MAKSPVSVLERQAVSMESPVANDELVDFSSLAEEATQLLGYSYLKDASAEQARATKNKREQDKLYNALRSAMSKLDIEPFTEGSVDAYKRKMKQLCTPKSERIAETLIICFAVGFCMGVLFFLGNGILAAIFAIVSSVPAWVQTIASTSSLGAVICLAIAVAILRNTNETQVNWVKIPLNDYMRPVPEFALQTAVDLKKECPQATFFVEEMITRLRKDPFLIAEAGGKQHYVEVWNEPSFKGVREA